MMLAQTNNVGVETQSSAITSNDTPSAPPSAEQVLSLKALRPVIDKAIASSLSTDATIADAALQCIKHYDAFKDARPIDRLVKGVAKTHMQPLIFWVKQNSPIYWDAKGDVRVYKPDSPNFKPLNVEALAEVPYHATKEAKARNEKALEPLTADFFVSRIANFKRMFENSQQADSKRAFENSYGSEEQVSEFLAELDTFLEPWKDTFAKAHKNWMKKRNGAAGTVILAQPVAQPAISATKPTKAVKAA